MGRRWFIFLTLPVGHWGKSGQQPALFSGLLILLSYTILDYTTHTELGPPTSIIIQENSIQGCPQASLVEAFSCLNFPHPKWPCSFYEVNIKLASTSITMLPLYFWHTLPGRLVYWCDFSLSIEEASIYFSLIFFPPSLGFWLLHCFPTTAK